MLILSFHAHAARCGHESTAYRAISISLAQTGMSANNTGLLHARSGLVSPPYVTAPSEFEICIIADEERRCGDAC